MEDVEERHIKKWSIEQQNHSINHCNKGNKISEIHWSMVLKLMQLRF